MAGKKKIGIRIISTILSIIMIFGILPMESMAAEIKESDWYVEKQLEETMPGETDRSTSPVVGEIAEKRTESEKHFRLEDGSSAVAIYDNPVHYEKDGQWKEIDNSLKIGTNENNGDVYENQDSSLSVKFAKNSDSQELVSLENEKGKMSWSLVNQNSRNRAPVSEFKVVTPPAEKRSIDENQQSEEMAVKNIVSEGVYENILPDVDMQYIVKSNIVKENIVLKSKDASNSYSFNINHEGLVPRIEEDGSISFCNLSNTEDVAFVFAAPFAVDANEIFTENASFSLDTGDTSSLLTVTVDNEWLTDSERKFPVIIDPYTKPEQKAEKIQDTFISSNHPNNNVGGNGSFLVGKNRYDGVSRSLVRFTELPQIEDGAIIYDAYIHLVQYQFSADDGQPFNMAAYEPTSSWNDRVTWNSQPGVDGNALDYVQMMDTKDYRWLNITKMVRQWYNTGVNNGIMLKSMAEHKYAVARMFASNYPFNTPGNLGGSSDYYPGGVFYYKNATGVEDYWNYHQQSAGTAGTGHTNDFNGNLTFVHEDTSTSDPLMAAAVNHVYNSSERNMDSRFGYGWRLNVLQQCMDVGGEVGKDFPYVYIDEDGTKHYFYNDNGTYKDEDGLDMVYTNISEGELKRQITLKDKTVLKFDLWNNIRRVIDPNGNTISYNHGPNGWGNFIGNMADGSGNRISFHYTGDDQKSKLTAISDEAGRMIHYSYDGIGNLSRITYPDGTSSSYYYDGHLLTATESSDGYRIEYQYSNDFRVPRVSKITEKASSGEIGQELSMQYKNGCTTVFEDGGVDGVLSTIGDNDITTYNFDKFGRMNDVYDKESDAVSVEYYSETSGSKKNKLQAESKLNKTAENLLTNGQVASHRNDSWYAKEYDPGLPFGAGGYSGLGYGDNYCFQVQKASTFSTAGIAQNFTNLPGGKYTFSSYVKVDSTLEKVDRKGAGAGVMLEIIDGQGNRTYNFGDNVVKTEPLQDDGWQRVTVTADVPYGANNVTAFFGLFDSKGVAYFDNLQLERNETASAFNLLNNGGFEHYQGNYSPYAWSVSGGQGTICGARGGGKFGNNILLMSSAPGAQNRLFQPIDLKPGKEGDVFTLSGWAKGSAPPKGVFRLAAAVIYQNHSPIWHNMDFDSNITDWQYNSLTFSTDDNDSSTNLTYVAVHIYLFYEDNTNEMFFDGLQLLKDSGQSYVYNDKGDLVSAKDAADSSKFNYDNNSNLKNMTDITGTSFNYSYDSKNNLTFANDSDGLSYKFTYDSKGNPLTSQINGSSEMNRIVPGKIYRIRQKVSGKYLNVFNGNDADETNVIQYEYDGTNNGNWRIESVGGGYYKFVSMASASGRVLDVYYGRPENYTNVQLYQDNGGDSQKFKLKLMPDGSYKILTKCSGDKSALDNGGLLDNGGNVSIYQDVDSPNLEWYFEPESFKTHVPVADTVYSFRNRLTGQYADVMNIDSTAGTRLMQCWYNGGPNQKFRLADAGENYFFIEPLHTDGMVLSQKGIHADYGNSIVSIQPKDETDDSQKFKFIKSENEYVLQCKDGGKYVEVAMGYFTSGTSIWTDSGNVSEQKKRWVLEAVSGTNIQSSSTYVNGTNKVATQTDARGNTITYGYTAGNRLLGNVTAGGNTTSYTYDGATDLLTSVSGGNDEQRVTNSYTYDKGKLKTINHNGFNYGFNYDGFGNVVSTNAGDYTLVTNSYNNQMGVLTKTTYGNGQYINYDYDRHGNISKTTNNAGRAFSYTYDSKQNPLTVTDSQTGKTTKFMYDFIGRPLRIDNGNHKMNVTYDDKNRVNSFSSTLNDITNKTNYMYGDALKGEAPSRIYGVMFNGNRALDYTYDSLARVQKKTLNTTTPFVTEYTYAPGTKADATTTLADSIKNNDNLLSYTYDAMGNILTVSNNGTLQYSYTYDSLNQLTSDVDHTTNTHNEYVYDKGGNILSKTSYVIPEELADKEDIKTVEYRYDDKNWKDKLTSYDGQTITYDQIGNPLTYRDGMSFAWENGRQMKSITANDKNLSFEYDDSGIRTKKTVNGVTTEYYVNGSSICTQVQGDTRLDFFYDDVGDLVGFNYNGQRYYYVRNVQNDIIGILDKDGKQVVSYTYDSWGKLLSVTGELAETIGSLNPFRYRGYYYDIETGFYYLNSRYYDPVVGRFVNADTIDVLDEDQDSLIENNLFAYCLNNPVNMTDSEGEIAWFVAAAAGGALWDTSFYLIECAMTGKKVTVKGVAKAAAMGAITGVALGAVGKVAVKAVKAAGTALKATKVGAKVTKGVTKATAKITAKVAKQTIKMSSNNVWKRSANHIFSKAHIKGGIMGLGGSQKSIFNKLAKVVNSNLSKAVSGSNQIHTTINGVKTTIRFYVSNGQVISMDAFTGWGSRIIGKLL